ncbi:MAG: hypothetical protein D6767_02460 [Candidatus Hydrogenedentota bacterium]|nr:MAG: hypothetical protein D6767_02460 [Candidatus Hydrogenedentota bacterium]
MMMTIGKGAAILTDSKKLNAIMKDLRTHSGSRNYRLRYDYTITDYQAALGIEQLGHLGSVLERRKALGRYYVENLHANQSYYSLLEKNVARDAFTGFPVFFEADTQITMKYFRSLRIATSKIMQPGPLHHLLALPASKYPNAERMYARAVVLPLYPTLKKAALERIVQAVKTFHP